MLILDKILRLSCRAGSLACRGTSEPGKKGLMFSRILISQCHYLDGARVC